MVGYRIENLDSISPSNKCLHCSFLLRDPVQLIECAHRICQSCANTQSGEFIICPGCKQKTSRNKLKLDRGCINDMQKLSIVCSLCDWNGLFKNFQNHMKEAHSNPICEYCNEQCLCVNDLYEHLFSHCPQVPVDCSLKAFGCQEKIRRIDLSNHYLTEQHQRIIIDFIVQWETSLFRLRNNHANACISQINKTTDALFATVKTLKNDQQNLQNKLTEHEYNLEMIRQDVFNRRNSIEEQDKDLDIMVINQENSKEEIISMQDSLSSTVLSYDGTLTWKITDVKQKIEAARSDVERSFYSPPFYSSHSGYKMCLRLYPYGDGNARQTHMSLYFVLLRGEFDAILHFPFCFNVIFQLLDQTDEGKHISDILKPDILSNCLKRPRSDMNVPSGISTFVALSILEQENNPYIRDDTMFIKAMVDFISLPKEIISPVMNTSSGLPMTIQDASSEDEIE
ncbi:hypothetical protein I4U23_023516 [Adineta vaga]|nr:hypothetical protein I4U23_023516 [Adineta vaga]